MNHQYVEDARQVVIMQANVLEKLVRRENAQPHEIKSLTEEVKRLRKLAAKLCEIREDLRPTPGLMTWNKGNKEAMKNWKPPQMGFK